MIRTYLGRVCRDLVRKTGDDARLRKIFAQALSLAFAVREQRQHQRGKKIYSLHAPEVECIGKGNAHRPYEFGVKVSLATTLHRSTGGQFIAHVKAMPGNPYDGRTLSTVPARRPLSSRGRGHGDVEPGRPMLVVVLNDWVTERTRRHGHRTSRPVWRSRRAAAGLI